MCADPACDVKDNPPAGETWCPRRLHIELVRWLSGHPMRCGPIRVNAQLLDPDRGRHA